MTNETTTAPATSSVMGMRLAHRMMTRDLVRLTAVAEQIADGTTVCPDRRACALRAWLDLLAVEIHHHHEIEDDVAWPVIAAHADPHVDLAVLSDDHSALDPMLDAVRVAAAQVVHAADRRAAAASLTAALVVLRDHLVEHLEAEEAAVFPVIERYVPPAAWKTVEDAAAEGGAGLGFVLPRAFAVLTPAERQEMLGAMGPAGTVFRLLAAVLGVGLRRRERLVFGQAS
jgi:iron-sulfur cluster repair protein YtfE (RIC family)